MKKCMGCMRDYSEYNDKCPVCGFSDEEYQEYIEDMKDSLRPETILGGRFILGRVLSSSDYSIVYIAWDALLQRRTAIKEYFPVSLGLRKESSLEIEFSAVKEQTLFEQGRMLFEREAEVLNKHQDVKELVNVYRCLRENKTSYIVMEYLEGCTLQDYLDDNKNLDIQSKKAVFTMIIDAVQALHERGIGHYNLTPDNICIENGTSIRLLDFGEAKKELYRMTERKIDFYRDGFIAPEVLLGQDAEKEADLYSLGAIYYYLMTGKEPKNSIKRYRHHGKLKMEDKIDERIVNLLAETHPNMRPKSVDQLWQICSAEDRRRFLGNGQK